MNSNFVIALQKEFPVADQQPKQVGIYKGMVIEEKYHCGDSCIEFMDLSKLHTFTYKFDAGPLSEDELKSGDFYQGNCRLALQDYFYQVEGKYLTPADILLPRGFREIGRLVKSFDNGDASFLELETGDVIYAEKIRDKNESPINKSRETFSSEEEWLISLHSAIYLGRMDREKAREKAVEFIWHASSLANGTALWPTARFLRYYRPVVAKRIE